MASLRLPLAELVVAMAVVIVSGFCLWDLRRVPPPLFDPLGAAALPRATCWLVIALALGMLAQSAFASVRKRRRATADTGGDGTGEEHTGDNRVAFFLLAGGTLAYVVALSFGWLDFAIATSLYVFASITALQRPTVPRMLGIAALALGLGLGCDYLFTRFFYIDLP